MIDRIFFVLVVIGAATAAVLIMVGGYCEARWSFFTIVRGLMRHRKTRHTEVLEPQGDPGLVAWLEGQRPDLPRPDFGCADGLRSWQRSLRESLLELFDLRDIGTRVEAPARRLRSVLVADRIERTFLTFDSFDGTRIPAYLFMPEHSAPRPAIIVLHGHVDGEEGIVQTAGIVNSYQNGSALELAKAGYVTLTFEFRGFGHLGARVSADYHLVAYNALLGGSFYKSILAKDIKYAVAFLQSLNEVSPERIGITGVSYGGEMALTYAALDERIKAVVCQGFGGELGVQPAIVGSRKTEQHPYYSHLIPGQNKYLLQQDFFLLVAPRPLLGIWGSRDFFGTPDFFTSITKGYQSLQASSHCALEIILGGGHEYFTEPAVQFFNREL